MGVACWSKFVRLAVILEDQGWRSRSDRNACELPGRLLEVAPNDNGFIFETGATRRLEFGVGVGGGGGKARVWTVVMIDGRCMMYDV